MPFAGKLPKPEDVVASGYDFAEHLLALQRQFAEDLLKATVPLIPGNGKSRAPAGKSAASRRGRGGQDRRRRPRARAGRRPPSPW